VRFGVFLPSFLLGGGSHAADVRAFARRAEELGFDSLWITDHVVTARRFYRVSWLDSLMTLSHVAAVTERVRLGTSILILPTRHPTILAKEIATLHHLSGGRFVYGIGTGWYGPEFEACGVHKSERGARTDEVLEATLALLSGPDVHFEGRFYRLDGVTVEPHVSPLPPVWSAGGSQLAHERSPEQPEMHPNVLRRIARADGWIARPTCPPDLIASDLELIRAARDGNGGTGPFTVAHENFTWIEERGSEADVTAVQQQRFGAVVSDERPWEYVDAVYMPGTVDRIQAKVQARIDAGVEYLMLHTLTADLDQLELIARHVVEPFSRARPRAGALT
jgi:probable F420-dependent oxidoreductase